MSMGKGKGKDMGMAKWERRSKRGRRAGSLGRERQRQRGEEVRLLFFFFGRSNCCLRGSEWGPRLGTNLPGQAGLRELGGWYLGTASMGCSPFHRL